jgi:hypothetical protein
MSFNRWAYGEGNPVNHLAPFGFWSIAPGFNLSNGGLYGQGKLTVPSALCTTPCYTTRDATQTASIFVPQKKNGILYNAVVLQLPKCDAWKLAIPTDTNDWEVVLRKSGTSWAFSQGSLTSLAVGTAIGVGLDDGMVPLGIEMDPSNSYNISDSIAFALFRAQS